MKYSHLFEKCQTAFDFAMRQLRHLIETHPDCFPMYTVNGKWKHSGEAWTNWCEGFLGGQLWLIYQGTGDSWWQEKAEHYSRLIEGRKTDRKVHDLGFLCSFIADNSLFIDIIMNVGIIFYAAQQTQDDNLWRIANQHCLTTRRVLVRGDGSTAHEGIFDAETGEFLYQSTHQGWRNDSSWARGLAWALYGFGTAYEFTNDARFLKIAEACANYYIQHTPEHGVPPNDWDEPDSVLPYESSAAAIAAGGMWNLSRLTGDPARVYHYRDYVLRILDTLTSPEFLAIETPGWEGILKHGIYHQRKGLGVDESVMWGDYFFLEVLRKRPEITFYFQAKIPGEILQYAQSYFWTRP